MWHVFYLYNICKQIYNLKLKTMANILWTVAVICVIIWAISFLGGFFTGGLIHILLVIAVIAIIYNLVTGSNRV